MTPFPIDDDMRLCLAMGERSQMNSLLWWTLLHESGGDRSELAEEILGRVTALTGGMDGHLPREATEGGEQ